MPPQVAGCGDEIVPSMTCAFASPSSCALTDDDPSSPAGAPTVGSNSGPDASTGCAAGDGTAMEIAGRSGIAATSVAVSVTRVLWVVLPPAMMITITTASDSSTFVTLKAYVRAWKKGSNLPVGSDVARSSYT